MSKRVAHSKDRSSRFCAQQDAEITLDDVANVIAGLSSKVLQLRDEVLALKYHDPTNFPAARYSTGRHAEDHKVLKQTGKKVLEKEVIFNGEPERSKENHLHIQTTVCKNDAQRNSARKRKDDRHLKYISRRGIDDQFVPSKNRKKYATTKGHSDSSTNEGFHSLRRCQNQMADSTFCDCLLKPESKRLRKKRISRGVQYESLVSRKEPTNSLNCFKPKSKENQVGRKIKISPEETETKLNSPRFPTSHKSLELPQDLSRKKRERLNPDTDKSRGNASKSKSTKNMEMLGRLADIAAEGFQNEKHAGSGNTQREKIIKRKEAENGRRITADGGKGGFDSMESLEENTEGKAEIDKSNSKEHEGDFIDRDATRKQSSTVERKRMAGGAEDGLIPFRGNRGDLKQVLTVAKSRILKSDMDAIKNRLDLCICELNDIIGDVTKIFRENRRSS